MENSKKKRGPKPMNPDDKKVRVEIFVIHKAVSKMGRENVKRLAENAVMAEYLKEVEP